MAAPRAKPKDQPLSLLDARLLALAVTLEPALAMARILGLSLDDLERLVAIGYFREFRRRGLSLRGMTQRFGKSLRTLAILSKRTQQAGPPLSGSQRMGRKRRVVALLATSGRTSRATISRRLRDTTREELDETLAELVTDGIVARREDRYEVVAAHVDLVKADLDHRIESLRHFLFAVGEVIYRRFWLIDDGGEAFARVFTFSASPRDLEQLRARLYALIREEVMKIDAESGSREDAIQGSITFTVVQRSDDPRWKA